MRNPQAGYTLRGRWLAACDGGQSFVRNALGLALEGTGYEGRYVIIDIELPSKHPTERRAWFDPPWNPGSTVLMHRQWTSVYRAGAMTLESYRHGRILFAGNAAHAMPIFGVRGLNSGFDDADNLAWKLAFVARGLSDAALLDSYSQERIAAFHVNAENAMRSTEFMLPPSRGFDLLREAALSLAGAHRGIAQLINPRQTQAVRYADSALSSEDESETLPAGPRPGEVMPEQQLEIGHLTHWIAPIFTLLVLRPDGAPDAAMADEIGSAQQGAWPFAVRTATLPGVDGGEARCRAALADALHDLPLPSLSG